MEKRPNPKPDDPEQSQRFLEEERKLRLDDNADREFGRDFDVIARRPAKSGSKQVSRKKRGVSMGINENVIAAFSEEHTSRLTGVTISQLRNWDRTQFYRPTYAEENRRIAFSRVYSFLDIVSLRVLNMLRNQFGVSLQHLREVRERLSHLEEDRWIGIRLWVVRKRVVWQEPGTAKPQEIISGQYIVPIVLEEVLVDTKNKVAQLNQRDQSIIGRIGRSRFINHNAPVVAGTRIPVIAIKRFAAAGYSHEQIIKEYPDLTEEDVKAALTYDLRAAA